MYYLRYASFTQILLLSFLLDVDKFKEFNIHIRIWYWIWRHLALKNSTTDDDIKLMIEIELRALSESKSLLDKIFNEFKNVFFLATIFNERVDTEHWL